jgi:uncharacterized protein YPO0396
MHSGGGSTPIPDPTQLTTDAVNAATAQWRRDLDAMRERLETRLDAADKATDLRLIQLANVGPNLHAAVGELRKELESARTAEREYITGRIELAEAGTQRVLEVSLEKFSAIDGTFASNALALTAALAAQKEAAAEVNKSGTLAIAKSEQTTKETINSNAIQTTASLVSQAALITDVKERVVRIEQSIVNTATNRTEGRDDRTDRRSTTQTGTQIAAAVIAFGIFAAALFFGLRSSSNNSGGSTQLPSCATAPAGTECVK